MSKNVDKNLYGPAAPQFRTDKWDNPIIEGGLTRLEFVALELLKTSLSDGKVDISRKLDSEIFNCFERAKVFLKYADEDFQENGSCMEPLK